MKRERRVDRMRAQAAERTTRRRSSARRATSPPAETDRSIALWRTVAGKLRLRDLNLHLTGLYAELGKKAYEALFSTRTGRSGKVVPRGSEELLARITAMRKEIERIAAPAGIGAGRRHT